MAGQRIFQGIALEVDFGRRVGRRLSRNERGSVIVSGIIRRRCICRDFVNERSGCNGQNVEWPDGSHPRRQRRQRLRSPWVIGSQRMGSMHTVGRQWVRRECVEDALCFVSASLRRLSDILWMERRLAASVVGWHWRQSADLERWYQLELLEESRIWGRRWDSNVSEGRFRERKRNCAWSSCALSVIVGNLVRCSITLIEEVLDPPKIRRIHLFWAFSSWSFTYLVVRQMARPYSNWERIIWE